MDWTLKKSANISLRFSYIFGGVSASHNFHEVNISQVLLQVLSGYKVLTALEAGKRYVPLKSSLDGGNSPESLINWILGEAQSGT